MFYGNTANISCNHEQRELCVSKVPCLQFIHEISDRLGFIPGAKLFSNLNQMIKHNKSSSRNILSLSAIFYTCNLEFYFPIQNFDKLCETKQTRFSLYRKFVNIWRRSGLDPPPNNPHFVIDFVISHASLPPKYSQDIFQIMMAIERGMCNLKLSSIKLPVLTCLAFCIYNRSSSKIDQICEILHLEKSSVEKKLCFVMSHKQIICNLINFDVVPIVNH